MMFDKPLKREFEELIDEKTTTVNKGQIMNITMDRHHLTIK